NINAGCCGYSGYGTCAGYCMGGYTNYAPAYIAPAPPGQAKPMPEGVPPPKPKPAPAPKDETTLLNQARLIIEVPADAQLFIDGHAMKTTAAKRVFRTPKLDPSLTYYYDVRAEVVRDGKTVTRTQRVILRAGDQVTTTFADLPSIPAE